LFRAEITPCSLRDCSSTNMLPRTPSAFQQYCHKAFSPFVLCCTAMFSYQEDDGFVDSLRVNFPCLEGGGCGQKTACQPYACLDRGILQETSNPLELRLTMLRVMCSVSLLRTGWLHLHLHVRTSGTALTARSGSLPLGPPYWSDEVVVELGLAFALTTRAPGQHCSSHTAVSHVRDMACVGMIWALAGALRRHPFDRSPLVLALQQLPLLHSTYCNHDSS
jgi:hypothetical protein